MTKYIIAAPNGQYLDRNEEFDLLWTKKPVKYLMFDNAELANLYIAGLRTRHAKVLAEVAGAVSITVVPLGSVMRPAACVDGPPTTPTREYDTIAQAEARLAAVEKTIADATAMRAYMVMNLNSVLELEREKATANDNPELTAALRRVAEAKVALECAESFTTTRRAELASASPPCGAPDGPVPAPGSRPYVRTFAYCIVALNPTTGPEPVDLPAGHDQFGNVIAAGTMTLQPQSAIVEIVP